jgi:DNA repair protein RecN (Recombination protein N)
MLTLLRVSGFALLEEVELSFSKGLTAITGETGAGKSILVEALGLLRGGRSSAEMVRSGAEEARVEAMFELPASSPLKKRLNEEGRTTEDGLLVRRAVGKNGRSRIHLGGSLATAAELASSIGVLCDITSQHDQQLLLDPDSQLAILDAFAGNQETLSEARKAFATMAQAQAELERFDTDARARGEREDLLRFQLTELTDADLQTGEDEVLKAERERIKGAEKFLSVCTRGEEWLYSGEDAVVARVTGISREVALLAQLDPALDPVVENLNGAKAQLEDAARSLARYAGTVRFDPDRLNEIEERLFLIGRLIRKHGGTLEAAIARRNTMAHELSDLGSFEEGLVTRRKALADAETEMSRLADELAERRRKAARSLGRRIDDTLQALGLYSARLSISLEARESMTAKGRERARFLFSPNPGEEPRPLERIASGGELSRVMLAVTQALSLHGQASTYVFDEVDAGVGGGTAEVIGRKLLAIAEHKQVLVVTHLPQIAAFAHQHLRVSKLVSKGRTRVVVEALEPLDRRDEIARMLGGVEPSVEALAHADEMLRRSSS